MAHSRRRRTTVAVPSAILAVAALAGSAFAVSGNQVVIGEDQVPETLNSIGFGGNTDSTNKATCPVQCENLLGMNKNFQYTAVLATRVPSGKDITAKPRFTVTFNIRPEAKWSDGKPVTSDDVKFTWQVQNDKKFKAASRTGWEEISAVQTPNPKTVKLVFKRNYVAWRDIYNPSGGGRLLPAHILRGKDMNKVWSNPSPAVFIGTGPFVLDSYKKGDRIVLKKNPNYWNKKQQPKIDKIIDIFLKSTTTQDVQLKSKEVNWIKTGAFGQPVLDLKKLPDIKVDSTPGMFWEHLAFNASDPVVGDARVRRAIAYAIDRNAIIRTSTLNTTTAINSTLVPQQAPYYKPSWARYSPNAGKVDSELRAAGYDKKNGFYEKGGQQLTITFATTAGNKTRETNFQLMKSQLEKNGIKFGTPVTLPPDQFFGETGPLNSGNFQVAEFAFQGSPDPSQTQIFGSKYIPSAGNQSGQNVYRIRDAALDGLLTAQDQEVSVAKRITLQGKIQDRMAGQAYVLPLYQRPEVLAYASNLQGVINNTTQASQLDQAQNWMYTGGKSVR